jgi:hypothetical protein
MYDELFEEGKPLKRELRLLAKTLRNPALISALDYIDKLEVKLVTAEGTINILESRGIKKPVSEILNKFRNPKTKTIVISRELVKKIKSQKICKDDLPVELQLLGDKVIYSFIILVKESREWGGEPCVGSSEAGSSLRGALPHLKKAGLLTTIVKHDGSQRGTGTYVQFTTKGKIMVEKIEKIMDLNDPLKK